MDLDKLKKFLDESPIYIAVHGDYKVGLDLVIRSFEEYLETGYNPIKEHASLTCLSWYGEDYCYNTSDLNIELMEKCLKDETFWNWSNFFESKEQLRGIYDSQLRKKGREYKKAIKEKKKKKKSQGLISSYVYLMKNNRNGYIKIGFTSKEPKYREKTLQSEDPDITLIYSKQGCNMDDEKTLHKEYSQKRLRGEWFDLDEDDVYEIKTRMNDLCNNHKKGN